MTTDRIARRVSVDRLLAAIDGLVAARVADHSAREHTGTATGPCAQRGERDRASRALQAARAELEAQLEPLAMLQPRKEAGHA